VLSWWDQARDSDGRLLPAGSPIGPATLQVGVYDETWQPVKAEVFTPYQIPAAPQPDTCEDGGVCDGRAPWGDRRTLRFSAPKAGKYHVALAISLFAEPHGSVAVANAQLEKVSAPDQEPGPYYGTSSTRDFVSSDCTGRSAADVQGSFEYKCDAPGRCYYDLVNPILIATSNNRTFKAPGIEQKLAQGNFNFRHVTVAVNLVGSGVHDCQQSPTSSCYGSGFAEYTLAHDAYDTAVLGWDGRAQRFNFGSASINHGKALSAERYITMPLGAADLGLLSQPGIEKQELRGRPLEGSYRLRIWDGPALTWDKLEDVQVILKYRYWSAIQAQPQKH
jgi:hypothetical protein